MKSAIEFKNIEKSFSDLKVLKNTSFSVKKGEITCLLGPSGSGKSTLFRLAAGLNRPDKGEVEILSGLRTGYIFQNPRLLPWKTVEENLIFIQKNYDLNNDKAEKLRDKLLELNGLADFSGNYPAQLSGGMKQRLEIIRGLSIWPDLLLMDEPFKSVDTQLKVNLRKMLLRFYEEDEMTVLLITHDPEEAVLLADKIYILSGKPAKIKKEFIISQPQSERKLNDKDLYDIIQQIISLFIELVDDYRWEKGKMTEKIFSEMR